ncbi:MAG: septation protein A [Gordonia sp.]|uniref:Intracellular septation protein A n=1 Tax=Gordonia rubripertincta TaxID=36822 RepID=A0ABT4MYU0_GORRU|nr:MULTISPECIES: hypothetical protein [Mycobacteriales]MBA4025106.1 septation protein A [Gordonia sp. (in: high G+C Gram-positive bacteria)]MCZ4552164.1 hypothetical protein [Gordonia rubripertincta]OZG31022.1 hypothetical protein BH683_000980 [Williamsia sp. 1138]
MNAKSMLLGFAPWIVFSVVAERFGADHVAVAAILAFVIALVLTVYETMRSGWKILDVAGVVTFGIIAAIGLVGDHTVDENLVNFGRGGSTFVLAAIMAISAFTIPFTEQYARESVDKSLWDSPIFRAKNKQISLMWAGVIFAIAVSHIIAGALTSSQDLAGSHPANIVLNWVVPIALIVFAIKRTRAIADSRPAGAGTQPAQ